MAQVPSYEAEGEAQRQRPKRKRRLTDSSLTIESPYDAATHSPLLKRPNPESSSVRGPNCSLKTCAKTIDFGDSKRVEVKATLPVKKKKNFFSDCVVEWSCRGDAVLHAECWDGLLKKAKSRSTRGNGKGRGRGRGRGESKSVPDSDEIQMCIEEKSAVKGAAETAEFHDSDSAIRFEASRIANLLKSSTHCIAFTGAGISTSAGIGDYRGKEGKWTEMDRTEMHGKTTASAQGKTSLDIEPEIVDEDEEENVGEEDGVSYEDLRPTYTHEALAKLVEMGHMKHVISQNGDGLHVLSDIRLDSVSELHGNVFLEICEKCGHRYYRSHYVMDDRASQYYEELEDFGQTTIIKPKHARKCSLCGLNHRTGRRCMQKGCRGFLKDSIINFRDNLEKEIMETAEMYAKKADLCLSLGTTMQVTPACELVEMGKPPLRLVIVNRQKTNLDHLTRACVSHTDGQQLGARVFGDTDRLMRVLMANMMSKEELKTWEGGRGKRMEQYDSKRSSN